MYGKTIAAALAALLACGTAAADVQGYDCEPVKQDAASLEWALATPGADLYDAAGRRIGRYFAPPSLDSDDGPEPQTAAPWLVLRVNGAPRFLRPRAPSTYHFCIARG